MRETERKKGEGVSEREREGGKTERDKKRER